MNKKEQIISKVKALLAACEIAQDTPNSQKYLEKYAADTHERFHPSTLAAKDMADAYSGDETPENVGVTKFCDSLILFFDGCSRISFPDSYTIKEIAELYYKEMRKKAVTDIKRQIQGWEITSDEVFSQNGISIH